MLVLPIVARELLIQARKKSTYWIRVAASALAFLLLSYILVMGSAALAPANQGKILFSSLSLLAFGYCLLVGPLVTANCLSAEKRDGTLGLLFLTNLKGHDVVLGKLVSSSIHCIYGLLAVLPMMSLALLLGGVSAGEIARTVLVLGNTLFFSLSAGMFVSTLGRNDRRIVFMAVLTILVVTAGPYEAAYLWANNFTLGTSFALSDSVLSPSPVFAFTLARSAKGTPASWGLYQSLAETHALAWMFLGASCALLPRVCRDRPKGRRRQRISDWSRFWRLGSQGARSAFRRRLLERNPCFWLSSRERHKAALVWFFIVSMTAIGLWVCYRFDMVFYEVSLFLLLVIHVLLKVWFAGEVCHRWIEDRQCGALELLLCAPLETREIVRGQGLALFRQFGGPVIVTVFLSLTARAVIIDLMGRGSDTQFGRTWLLIGVPVLIADLFALRWVGAWLGLTARGLNRAIGGAIAQVLWLRWLICILCFGGLAAWNWLGFGVLRPDATLVVFWFALALSLDFLLGWSARRRFLRYFRTIAANPMDYRIAVRRPSLELPVTSVDAHSTCPSPVQVSERKRRLTRIAWVGAIAFLVACIPLGYRAWLKRQVSQRLQAAQQAGFPITIKDLDQRRPSLADEANAALVVERAFTWYVAFPGLAQFPGPNPWDPLIGSLKRSEPLPAGVKGPIKFFLSTNQTSLAILRDAPSLRQGRYVTDWYPSGVRFSAQYQGLLRMVELLRYDVLYRADAGDVTGALASLHRLLDICHSLEREPIPMFFSVRQTCLLHGFTSMEWLLSRHSLPESELKALEQEISEAEAGTDLQAALVGLRCFAVNWYRPRETGPAPVILSVSGAMEQLRFRLRNWIYDLTGAKDRDFIRYLDTLDQYIRLASIPLPERYLRGLSLGVKGRSSIGSQLMPSSYSPRYMLDTLNGFDRLIAPEAKFVARCRAARTAVLIEQYRLRHSGQLPEKLDSLVPDLIGALIRDPFDGQPLRYKRLSSGYQVYSVGKNGIDDYGAGDGLPQKNRARQAGDDLVFSVD
ncbi:MAG: ABC transporter permease [Candidatus Omnitrophica bacterium]|nr:ABC transporter permease [Candidatus Omnitrophota bacterium]